MVIAARRVFVRRVMNVCGVFASDRPEKSISEQQLPISTRRSLMIVS